MTREQKLGFLNKIAPWAQAAQQRYGVPTSVTIAQAILESDWGRSSLSAKHNNFFGIKAARSGNRAVELPTWEVIDGKRVKVRARFRVFASPAECFDWRGAWLLTSKRYAPAMAHAGDPLVFAVKLWECGYATDPKYPEKLRELIQRFDLTQWDLKRDGGTGRMKSMGHTREVPHWLPGTPGMRSASLRRPEASGASRRTQPRNGGRGL